MHTALVVIHSVPVPRQSAGGPAGGKARGLGGVRIEAAGAGGSSSSRGAHRKRWRGLSVCRTFGRTSIACSRRKRRCSASSRRRRHGSGGRIRARRPRHARPCDPRPARLPRRPLPGELPRGGLLFEFTVGDQVLQNVQTALDGGVRRFVIGTTNWAGDRAAVEATLIQNGAAAVASSTFSLA